MDKVGIAGVEHPKYTLELVEEEETIDLEVLDITGDWVRTLIRIDKESLEVTVAKGTPTDFETNRKGEVEIYEQ